MKVTITGASGMLGRHVVTTALADGADVRVWVRPESDTRALPVDRLDVVSGHAGDDGLAPRLLAGADVVIHCAGYLTVSAPFGGSDQSPAYRRVNVDVTERLLTAALAHGVQRFVYVSSSSVYGAAAPVPTPEDAPLSPSSAYGRSKVAAEERVAAFGARGLPVTIVRPTVIYGPGDRYFTPMALRLARLPLLPLVNGGRNVLDLVFVQDVATLLWQAAQRPQAVGRVYNSGAGQPGSLRDLIDAFRELTGRGPRVVAVSAESARLTAPLARLAVRRLLPGAEAALTPDGLALMARDNLLDMRRARAELGYTPRFSLRDGLARTLPHFA